MYFYAPGLIIKPKRCITCKTLARTSQLELKSKLIPLHTESISQLSLITRKKSTGNRVDGRTDGLTDAQKVHRFLKIYVIFPKIQRTRGSNVK